MMLMYLQSIVITIFLAIKVVYMFSAELQSSVLFLTVLKSEDG